MNLGGIDGCKAGWIMILWDGDKYSFHLHPDFNDLTKRHSDLTRILVDIPVGLGSEGYPRTIESLLRRELRPRGSTVFNPPVYEALYEDDPDKARAINRAVEGKSLSVQTLNICHKIREVNQYLSNHPQTPIYECHPEFAFKKLNGDQVLLSKKSTSEGREDRLRILEKFEPQSRTMHENIMDSTHRSDVKSDDILDAMVLCIVNRMSNEDQMSFLEDQHSRNHQGIEIKIAYFRP